MAVEIFQMKEPNEERWILQGVVPEDPVAAKTLLTIMHGAASRSRHGRQVDIVTTTAPIKDESVWLEYPLS